MRGGPGGGPPNTRVNRATRTNPPQDPPGPPEAPPARPHPAGGLLEVTDLRGLASARCSFFRCHSLFFATTHILERREQLRPLLRAVADADALKRGASLEEVSRLHDELTRGAPVLERLLADGVAGRFPAAEACPRASAQASQAPQPAHGPLLRSRAAQKKSCETLREKRKALRQRRIRTSDIASLAQIERELYEVEEQLDRTAPVRGRLDPRAAAAPSSLPGQQVFTIDAGGQAVTSGDNLGGLEFAGFPGRKRKTEQSGRLEPAFARKPANLEAQASRLQSDTEKRTLRTRPF